MDSITQALLGATIAATIAPKSMRKRALFIGAGLGTLPDLDVVLEYATDVDNFTHHRGFSHSLFVLPFISLLLLPLIKRAFGSMSWIRTYLLIVLSLTTHPLLDALTAYGTQLFYPLFVTPTFISSIFIIDPLYTIWLLIGAITYLISPHLKWVNALGLLISTLYLVFGFTMQNMAKNHLAKTYPSTSKNRWFVGTLTASPFCWRGVYVDEDSYMESAFNILNSKNMTMAKYEILPPKKHPKSSTLDRLLWFNPNTVLRYKEEKIISSDLRMGEFGNYFFQFIISPKQESGKRAKPITWEAKKGNLLYKQYKAQSIQSSFPKHKWSQFIRCLNGKL